MLLLSATDVAISAASLRGDLRLEVGISRFGGEYVAISDRHGLIEVADDMAAAEARVARIVGRG